MLSTALPTPSSACLVRPLPAVALVLWLCLPGSDLEALDGRQIQVRRQLYLMGTRCELVTYAPQWRQGLERLEGMLRILEHTEAELSTWRPDSLLSRLNRHPVGSPFPLEGRLCPLLRELQFWAGATGAAFDPGLGSLIDAWGFRSGGRLPDLETLKRARHRTGVRFLELDSETCRVVRQRPVLMDAGAFGKGEALDRVSRHLRELPQQDAWLVDLGGQLMVAGRPPEGSWEVAVAHPHRRLEPFMTLRLTSGALATSGGSERDLQAGDIRIGHILDPRSGRPASFRGSVTVWHPRGLLADILSTALYVMGPAAGLEWARERQVAACYLEVSQEGGPVRVRATPAFRDRFLDPGR